MLGPMKASSASVLHWIAQKEPCTKLCVKTHSGLSMATVLAAVDTLSEQGWVQCRTHTVPQGGKPHAALTLGRRCFWGVCPTEDGYTIASCTPRGEVADQGSLPPDATGVCIAKPVGSLSVLSAPMALCYAHCLPDAPCAVVWDLVAYAPLHPPVALGDMPAPMLAHRRLDYREAFALATPAQAAKLQEELSLWLGRLWGVAKVYFADDLPHPTARTAALAARYIDMVLPLQKTAGDQVGQGTPADDRD